MLALLAAAPVFLGIVLRINTPPPGAGGGGGGPGVFIGQIADNGVFLSLFAIYVLLPVVVPLAVAVVSGDSVAGEAGLGTLRTLLTVPAGRIRLLLTKYLAIVVFCFAAYLLIAVIALVLGAVLFPIGPVTLLSGDTVSLAAGLARLALIVLYVVAALAALGAIGLALSTFTQHAIAVMASVLVIVIVSEILDAVSQVAVIHPYLPTHFWLDVRRAAAHPDRVGGRAARAGLVRGVRGDLPGRRVHQDAAGRHHQLGPVPRGRSAVRFAAMPPDPDADVAVLLAAAVAGIGGAERPGQVAMAKAVQPAIESGEHLAVQAGTGTGKSLAYLVPAARHAVEQGATVVVSTATIALQRQLIDRDLPQAGRHDQAAAGPGAGVRDPEGPPELPVPAAAARRAGRRRAPRPCSTPAWSRRSAGRCSGCTSGPPSTKTGDRDEIVPGVSEQAWRQVSVSARECVGVQRCPFGSQCFAELAREEAGKADIVVTNHALLAIDALEDYEIFPEHDVVIIDEAHDLVDRVTSVATDELSAPAVETAARRCGKMIDDKAIDRLRDAGAGAELALAEIPAGRLDVLDEHLAAALTVVRDAAAGCAAEFRSTAKASEEEPERVVARRAALAAIGEVGDAAERMLEAFEPPIAERADVVWMDRPAGEESNRPPTLRVAPLRVGGLLASRLFGRRTTVLTSATLVLGGSFEPLARQWGLAGAPEVPEKAPPGAAGRPAAAGRRTGRRRTRSGEDRTS